MASRLALEYPALGVIGSLNTMRLGRSQARRISSCECLLSIYLELSDPYSYERYQVISLLANEPNFRWCLNPECKSGQLWESAENAGIWVLCQECKFEMCFRHQVPWHDGLTCAEYDAKIAREGDIQKSEQWIQDHTKPCPGPDCNKPVQKGPGCFHMTCKLLLSISV
jgi:hypothetical protein